MNYKTSRQKKYPIAITIKNKIRRKDMTYEPRAGWQKITPTIAEDIVTNFRMENQRPVKDSDAVLLMEEIKNGTFTGGTIEIGHFDEKWYLLDGQHRLCAIEKADKSVEMNVVIYEANSMEDLLHRFSVIDRGRPRDEKDLMKINGVTDEYGFSAAQASLVYKTALLAHAKLCSWKKSEHSEINNIGKRISWAKEWAPYAFSIFALIKKSKVQEVSRVVRSPKVFAFAMILMKAYPEKAKKFWSGVISASNLEDTDPAHTLHRKFSSFIGKRISQETKLSYAVFAWNMFYVGKKGAYIQIKPGKVRVKGLDVYWDGKDEREANRNAKSLFKSE